LTANSGANWLKYRAVHTADTEDEKATVEFEPRSQRTSVRVLGGNPSLAIALLRTVVRYFAFAGVLILCYSTVIFINPFLLR